MTDLLKLSIIIPVYNEKKTVEAVIRTVMDVPLDLDREIIVVDGGSVDGTREILEKMQGDFDNLKMIFEPAPSGRGSALKKGMAISTGDVIIFQDADFELDPHDYPHLLREFDDPDISVVFGSRFMKDKPAMTFLQAFGNNFLTGMVNLLFRCQLTDVETCYQMFKRSVVADMTLKNNDFAFTVELTIKLIKKGLRIKEVPIHYVPRGRQEGKKIYWMDGFISLWTIFDLKFFSGD